MTTIRTLHTLRTNGNVRKAQHEGRTHLVVPVVALMEGVIHAVNASTPEFVPLSTLQRAAHTWNGRPIVLGHPAKNGLQISANDPDVRDAQAFGTVFNTKVQGKKLLCEAWIDVEKAKKIGADDLLRRLEAGETTEVSVGAYVVTDDIAGNFNGRAYNASWKDTTGDHLAFLPQGRGACSVEMGCGSHRAAGEALDVHDFSGDDVTLYDERNLRPLMSKELTFKEKKPMALRERFASMMKALAGAYDTPEQMASEEAAELVAYNVLRVHLDALGKAWDEASALVDDLIADEEKNPTQTKEQEAAETEVERARIESLMSLTGAMSHSASCAMSVCMGLLAPEMPVPSDPRYMEARAAIGKKISAATMKSIQASHDAAHAMHDHTTALGAECDSKLTGLAEQSVKQDGGQSAIGEATMTKEQRAATIKTLTECGCNGFTDADVKMLEAASDERLTAFAADAEKRKTDAAALKAAQENEATLKAAAAAAPKELTEEEFMKAAPASVRALIANEKARVEARTAELVGQLKTAQTAYSEEELKALSLDALEKLAKVAKLDVPVADFSGRGIPAPRTAGSKTEDFTPPDGYSAALKTAQKPQAIN